MRIICVDPSAHDIVRLTQKVRQLIPDSAIYGCGTAVEALARARAEGCDVLLTEIDLESAQMDGFVLAEQMAGINPRVNIIFMSGRMDNDKARLALELHASGYLNKPCRAGDLEDQLDNLRFAAG